MTSLQAQIFTGLSRLVKGLPGDGDGDGGGVDVGFPLCPVSSRPGPNTDEAVPGSGVCAASGVDLVVVRRGVVAVETVWLARTRGGTTPVDVTACLGPLRAGPVAWERALPAPWPVPLSVRDGELDVESSAHATGEPYPNPTPIPMATAKVPTRPTYCAYPCDAIQLPPRLAVQGNRRSRKAGRMQ
ncbi:hypothetical protein [Mycobacterium sp. SA01]|uniref:hypothetical protein n=1 Tax=Mycobacterium sp. SA01 TaxID=3238820 RepID=UPI00351B8711